MVSEDDALKEPETVTVGRRLSDRCRGWLTGADSAFRQTRNRSQWAQRVSGCAKLWPPESQLIRGRGANKPP
ncbi:hypothetical protein AOLI_G00159780 [Acnodon oligacanthus]